MEGGGWYGFAAPLPNAHPRLAGPLLLRPLQFSAYGILTAVMIFMAAAAALLVLPSLLLLMTPEGREVAS